MMKGNNPLLIDTGRGFSVFYKNKHLYNQNDPEGSAVSRASKLSFRSDTLYIIPSMLLFYGFREIVTKLPEDSHIICFELSDELLNLSREYIPLFVKNNPNVSVIETTDPLDLLQTIEKIGIWKFRRVKIINLSRGYSLFASEYRDLTDTIAGKIEGYWKNRMTLIHMAPMWINNIIKNINNLYLSPQNRRVMDFPETEYPILVAGAGESLELSINEIKKYRTSFKILAVDTALSVLIENDITPDYIIAVDGQIFNLYDFIRTKGVDIPLFFDLTGYPGIPKLLKGPIYPFISNFAEIELLKKLKKFQLLPQAVPPLGSVGLTAVYLALKLSGSKVVYTGLDFSYLIGKSHANGAPAHISRLIDHYRLNPLGNPDIYFRRPLIKLKDKRGDTVTTDLILSSYAELMKNIFGENNRLYDIGTKGLESGGKTFSLKNIILENEHYPCLDKQNQLSMDKPENILVKNFFNNELETLKELYSTIYGFLNGETKDKELLLKKIKESDYLYIHFPDKSPNPSTDSNFLKRVLVSCTHYINIFTRYS